MSLSSITTANLSTGTRTTIQMAGSWASHHHLAVNHEYRRDPPPDDDEHEGVIGVLVHTGWCLQWAYREGLGIAYDKPCAKGFSTKREAEAFKASIYAAHGTGWHGYASHNAALERRRARSHALQIAWHAKIEAVEAWVRGVCPFEEYVIRKEVYEFFLEDDALIEMPAPWYPASRFEEIRQRGAVAP